MSGVNIPLQTLGGYGDSSAALSFNGNQNIGGTGGSYGTGPGMQYASGDVMSGMNQGIAGTYQTNTGNQTVGSSVLGTGNQNNTSTYGPPAPTTQNNGGSGMDSQLTQLQKMQQAGGLNPAQQTQYNQLMSQYMSSQQNSAAQQAAANITAATNQYNTLRAQLENQRPVLDNAYQTGLSDINNQLQLGQQQGQANSSQLTSSYNAGMGQLGQQYQSDQAQNRELARSMGGNGSDYAQLQNKTSNTYQNNQFASNNDYQSRLTQINQGLQSLQQWGTSQTHDLATQYQQGINQLVLNEDMTDFSKAQAIQQIQSDYSKQLANINSVVAQFGNQLSLAKAQVDTTALMFGKQVQGYDPLSNMANMFYGSLGTQAPTIDASGGINYNNNTAGGINNNQNGAASY